MNYARSLIEAGRPTEAVEILSREVPQLEAIPLGDGGRTATADESCEDRSRRARNCSDSLSSQ